MDMIDLLKDQEITLQEHKFTNITLVMVVSVLMIQLLYTHLPSNQKNTNHQEHAISQELITQDLEATADQNLNIYAVNYNVLRIMSGMGGLAYSN